MCSIGCDYDMAQSTRLRNSRFRDGRPQIAAVPRMQRSAPQIAA
jgi:hypothetical protein